GGKANRQHSSELCRDGEAYGAERRTGAPRKPSKPRLRTLVKRAEKATGKTVTAITTLANGVTKLDLGTEPAAPENPWPLDEFRTKETKQRSCRSTCRRGSTLRVGRIAIFVAVDSRACRSRACPGRRASWPNMRKR